MFRLSDFNYHDKVIFLRADLNSPVKDGKIISDARFRAVLHTIRYLLEHKAKVVIGVVKGDIHEIGKNIVAQFLKAAGYYIIDLGRNAPPEKFIEAVKNNNAEFLAMSTLMSPTLEQMKIVIEKLKKEGIRDKIKVIIGGAPTDEKFAKDIGADYCCKDANEVVSLLDSILDKLKS